MRKRIARALIGISLLAWQVFVSAATILPEKTVTLVWDYPALSTDIVFNVYQTTNLAIPAANWTLLTNVTATSCAVRLLPGNQFFAVTASNTLTHLESFR